MATVISARNLCVEQSAIGKEMARVTIEVTTWDGSFHFEVGTENRGTREDVLEELRARLVLLFQSAVQELAQGPIAFRENQ
jgi:hypothetical protein